MGENEEECVCSYCGREPKKDRHECPRCGNVFRKEKDG